jgi:hypothetical protein
MLVDHNFVIPHYNLEPRYKKPILYYWIQAPFVKLFGVNEVAARLPSAVLSLGLVLLVHSFLLFWLPRIGTAKGFDVRARGAAFLGAGILATLPLLAVWARAAVTDPTLTFFITATLLAFLQADLLQSVGEGKPRRWYIVGSAAMALAFLTKGPVAVLVPVVTWVAYHLWQRDLAQESRRVPWVPAIGLFLLIAIPWFAVTPFVKDGQHFLAYFFGHENIERFSTTMENHGGKGLLGQLLFYWPCALLLLFPASAYIIRDLFQPFGGHPSLPRIDLAQRLRRFALCWIVGTIGLFSLAKTQLPSYIQMIVVAAAILVALHILGRVSSYAQPPATRRARIGAGVEAVLLAFFGVAFTAGPAFMLLTDQINGDPMGRVPVPHGDALVVSILLGCCLVGLLGSLLVAMRRRSPAILIGGTTIAWTATMAVLLLGVAPLVVRCQYQQVARIGRILCKQPASHVAIAFKENERGEGLIYYGQRHITYLNSGSPEAVKQMMTLLDQDKTLVLVTTPAGESIVRALGRITPLDQVGDYRILRLTPFVSSR